MFVIRTSKTGKLANSKPCYNCIMNMINLPPKKGYKINRVYYSNDDGTITSIKLNDLYNAGNFHYSAFYKNQMKKKLKQK